MAEGDVCPKCNVKDNFEFSAFKQYIEQNGTENSLQQISIELGIQEKNLNRFLGYEGLQQYAEEFIPEKVDCIKELNNENSEVEL